MRRPGQVGTGAPPLRVDVLGPLRLAVDGTVVEVPGPKRRAVLVMLAMAEGRAVSVDDLLDAIWPSGDPDAGRATLHSHISRLRGHLGPAATRLEGLEGGYRLALDASDLDAGHARALLGAAKELLATDPDGARARLAEARRLWRGPPLPDLLDVPLVAAWCVALHELRREVEETFAAAAIQSSHAADAVVVAGELVVADPLREPGVLLLMRALWKTGRATEALRAGYDLRQRLRSEAGLDPSQALSDLESEIAGTSGATAMSIPQPTTRLHGRDAELAALHRLLADERLITVIGPGGVGKTSLAFEVARRADTAVVLMLAPVTDPAAIPHALAAALDLRVMHGDVLPACAALLGTGRALLLIDNCEHVLTGARDVVAALLANCPELTVLTTSREPLGLVMESRFRLAPLPLPDAGAGSDARQSPAVAAFLDRARRVQPAFAPTPEDLLVIGDIVRHLEGIPLAIELAAGRLSAIGLSDLHARLDRALDLLGDGRPSADARHSTLRQTIRWSYELLAESERDLFCHLAVFPDGFDLPTAERIAADLGIAGATDAMTHLVDASMVEPQLGQPTRYRMLDTLRAFARDELAGTDGEVSAAARFRDWVLDLVASVDAAMGTDAEPAADRDLRRELANLRAMWRLTRELGHLDDAVTMGLGLADAGGWRDLTEIWGWALELADDEAIETHPRAAALLGWAANSAWARGELEEAERLVQRGLGLADNDEGRWGCLSARALVALSRGQLDDAMEDAEKAAALASRPDQNLGIVALAGAYRGRLDDAWAALERNPGTGSPTLQGFHSYVAGEIESVAGNTELAERHYADAITSSRRSGATFVDGIASVGLMTVRAAAGRTADALAGYRELIDYWERTHAWVQQWTTLRNLARLLHDLGDHETAAFLEVAADHAPDAPTDAGAPAETIASERSAEMVAEASSSPRIRVLERARDAIDRHLAELLEGAGRR